MLMEHCANHSHHLKRGPVIKIEGLTKDDESGSPT